MSDQRNPTDKSREPDETSPADAAFVERLSVSFAPPPLDDAGRHRFDRALRARIEHRHTGPVTTPRLALAATVVAAFAWLAMPAGGPSPHIAGSQVTGAAAEWESNLLDPDADWLLDEAGEGDDLPPDYAAIGGLLLDG